MGYISRAELEKLLGITPLSIKENALKTVLAKNGPGQLSGWDAFEGRDCFIQSESKKSSPSKKKIIISDARFLQRTLLEFDLDFINALIREFDVYLWPGDSKKFRDLSPLTSSSEFWEKRENITQHSMDEVRETLSKQSITSHDFIIIDTKTYSHIRQTTKTSEKEILYLPERSLTLYVRNNDPVRDIQAHEISTYTSIYTDKLVFDQCEAEILHIEAETHKTITISQNNDFRDVTIDAHLPLHKISIETSLISLSLNIHPDPRFTLTHDSLLIASVKKLNIMNNSDMEDYSFLKTPRDLEDLSVSLNTNYPKLNALLPLTELRNLSLSDADAENIELDLSYCQKLTSLTLNNTTIKNLDYAKLPSLQKLHLNSVKLLSHHMDVSNIPHLQHLTLINLDINKISLGSLKLKSLSIHNCENYSPQLNISDIQSVESVLLDNIGFYSGFVIQGCTISRSLTVLNASIEAFMLFEVKGVEEVKISNKNNVKSEYSFSSCPKLNKVTIDHEAKSLLTLFHDTPNLMELTIQSKNKCELYHLFDTNITSLKRLTLINCNIDNKTINIFPDSLEYLKIDGSNIKSLDLSSMKNLRVLSLNNMENLTQIDMTSLTKVEVIEIHNLKSTLNDLIIPSSVIKLVIATTAVNETIDLTNCKALESLLLQPEENKLDELTIQIDSAPSLKSLTFNRKVQLIGKLQFQNVEHLEISGGDAHFLSVLLLANQQFKLKYLHINMVETLSLNKLPTLETIVLDDYSENKNNSVTLRNLPKLSVIKSRRLGTPPITITNCPLLQKIQVAGISDITIVDCPSLTSINDDLTLLKELEENNGRITKIKNIDKVKKIETLSTSFKQSAFSKASDDEKKLNQLNQASPVAYFSPKSSATPDSNTQQGTTPKQDSGEYKLTLHAKDKKFDKRYYRLGVCTKISNDNNKLLFSYLPKTLQAIQSIPLLPFKENTLSTLKEKTDNEAGTVCAHLQCTLSPDQYSPLPLNVAVHPSDLISIHINPSDAVTLHWDKEQQQFYIKLHSSHKKNLAVEIAYRAKITFHKQEEKEQKISDLLPKDIIDFFNQNKNKLPAFIFDTTLKNEKKLEMLTAYFKLFSNKALSTKPTSDLEIMLAIIHEKSGACRHRAEAFFLLARFIGIKIDVIEGYNHMFIEASVNDRLNRIDLGGEESLDLTPAEKLINPFAKTREQIETKETKETKEIKEIKEIKHSKTNQLKQNESKVLENTKETKQISTKELATNPQTIKDPLLQYAYEQFVSLAKATEFTLNKSRSGLMPLIVLSDNQRPEEANLAIQARLRESKHDSTKQILYIHTPRDLLAYLSPYQLNEQTGKRTRINGPLADMLNDGGTLIINWSTFSAAELTTYKSILDTIPTLEGRNASKLHVINLSTPSTRSCSAFTSRCEPFHLTSDFLNISAPKETKESKKESKIENQQPITVDLFKRASWKDMLLGKIQFTQKGASIEQGPLLTAIKNKTPLIIVNVPEDNADFDLYLYRIMKERRLLYNGKLIDVPTEVDIRVESKQHNNKIDNVTVRCLGVSNKKINESKETNESNNETVHHYLHINNIHECIEQLIYSEKEVKPTKGLLESFANFHVSGFIPESEWQYLLHYIEKNYPKKSFVFTLLPGSEIVTVMTNNNTVKVIKEEKIAAEHSVYRSNDPDFLAMQLSQKLKDPLIIDINNEDTFHEQVYSVSQDDSSDQVAFHQRFGALLQALTEGRNVILNGDMNPTLYCQLLPYFNSPCTIMINGKDIALKGKLIAVLPESSFTPNIPFIEKKYTWEDYALAFKDQNISSIKLYASLGNLLPHRGEGRPHALIMTHQRIQSMLDNLQKPLLHLRNPIKGLIQHDYPKKSEDYAYLNVIGKCLFAPKDTTPIRLEKLNKFRKQFTAHSSSDITQHLWRCLNCLSGTDLIKLFGTQDIASCIQTTNGFPILKQDIIDKFYTQFILPDIKEKKEEKHQEKEEKSSANDIFQKREKQLQTLIHQSNKHILFIKGNPGVGKSYTLRAFKNNNKYRFIEEDIANFLENYTKEKQTKENDAKQDDRPILLLLDEANLKKPGTLNYLKALSRGQNSIVIHGKQYLLPKNLRIVATGNPEDFQGRYYDPLWMNYAETVYFKEADETYLKNQVLSKILTKENGLANDTYFDLIIKTCELTLKHNPFFEFSIREVEDMAWRFVSLANKNEPLEITLYKAAMGGFVGGMYTPQKRAAFKHDLRELFTKFNYTLPEEKKEELTRITVNHEFKIPSSRAHQLDTIDQALQLHDFAQKNPNLPVTYKRGVLLRGSPGIGKSTLYVKRLEKWGFVDANSPDAKSSAKKYYMISAGSQDLGFILKKAREENAPVILDEPNVDPTIEADLITFLEKGLLFASENPAHYEGRSSTSPAISNRLNVINAEDPSTDELRLIAEGQEAIVEGLLLAQKEHPNKLNTRSFFTIMKLINSIDIQLKLGGDYYAQNDLKKALDCFERARYLIQKNLTKEQNGFLHSITQKNMLNIIGKCYSKSDNNEHQSFGLSCFLYGAEQKNAECAYYAGHCAACGTGLPEPNMQLALSLWKQAEEQKYTLDENCYINAIIHIACAEKTGKPNDALKKLIDSFTYRSSQLYEQKEISKDHLDIINKMNSYALQPHRKSMLFDPGPTDIQRAAAIFMLHTLHELEPGKTLILKPKSNNLQSVLNNKPFKKWIDDWNKHTPHIKPQTKSPTR